MIKLTFFTMMMSLPALPAFGGEALARPDAAVGPRLELRQKTSVTGARVYLTDVAKCSGSADLCGEATGIDVGGSPTPGRSGFIQKSAIEALLEKEWPGVVVTIEGPESVRIDAVGVEVSADELRTKLQDFVSDKTRAVNSDVRVSVQRVQALGMTGVRPTQSRVEFADVDLIQFQNLDWISRNLAGSRMLQIRVVNPADAEDKTTFQAQATFVVERQLPVLKQSVTAGQVIDEGNIVMSWVAMRRGPMDYVIASEALSGRKARQSINSGEPVPGRYVESPLAVTRNQPVTIIVRKGDLEISSRATTVDQGGVGQTIEVVNLATKRRMRARIVDEKTVEAVAF
jgi:flagella basal body P-ring formation protein FlgA